jgi:carbonic anhydrase
MRSSLIIVALSWAIVWSGNASAGNFNTDIHKHWWTYYEYGGHGPSRWALVDKHHNAACRRGRAQSPINITHFKDSGALPALAFNYWQPATELHNTGHALQLEFPRGNTMSIGGQAYDLVQVHFHHRAEHLVKGKRHGMEAHFVHQNAAGQLAVVAVMFKYGAANEVLHDLGSRWPDHKGAIYHLPGRPYPFELLPQDKTYYTYTGSLTMPPCTEGVKWIVMKQPLTLSVDQVWQMEWAMNGHNHRPVQRRNNRLVFK